ncbi:Phage integrase, partial [uncultured Rubrobacteraceae bacterium]
GKREDRRPDLHLRGPPLGGPGHEPAHGRVLRGRPARVFGFPPRAWRDRDRGRRRRHRDGVPKPSPRREPQALYRLPQGRRRQEVPRLGQDLHGRRRGLRPHRADAPAARPADSVPGERGGGSTPLLPAERPRRRPRRGRHKAHARHRGDGERDPGPPEERRRPRSRPGAPRRSGLPPRPARPASLRGDGGGRPPLPEGARRRDAGAHRRPRRQARHDLKDAPERHLEALRPGRAVARLPDEPPPHFRRRLVAQGRQPRRAERSPGRPRYLQYRGVQEIRV